MVLLEMYWLEFYILRLGDSHIGIGGLRRGEETRTFWILTRPGQGSGEFTDIRLPGPWPYQCFVHVLEYYLLVIPYKTSIKQQFIQGVGEEA